MSESFVSFVHQTLAQLGMDFEQSGNCKLEQAIRRQQAPRTSITHQKLYLGRLKARRLIHDRCSKMKVLCNGIGDSQEAFVFSYISSLLFVIV